MITTNEYRHYFHIKRRHYRRVWRKFTWTFASIFLLTLTVFTISIDWQLSGDGTPSVTVDHFYGRSLLQVTNDGEGTTATTAAAYEGEEAVQTNDAKFPDDLFSESERRNGAIILHIIGLIYMFVALAIVCDEFFIPALDVITEKLAISEDVAGATFMAAGGSAPELFTSIIGVFISFDDVGIGTIVGSAVFNILFVLSMCAIFSKTVLELTWWPLFRDVSFYSLILITLVICFKDSTIFWYEAVILLIWYAAYVTFMKYNETLEQLFKKFFARAKVNKLDLGWKRNGDPLPTNYQFTRKMSTPILHGGSKFRQGVLQLMIHSIDPLYEEPVSLAMKNGQEFIKDHVHPPGAPYCPFCGEDKHGVKINSNGVFHTGKPPPSLPAKMDNNFLPDDSGRFNGNNATKQRNLSRQSSILSQMQEIPEPLDVSWPNTARKRITFVMLAPIIIPLWLTLPDVRRPEKQKWFAFAFIGSIVWIAIYSYLMVWWATLVGDTFRMPSEIMGLTFLAAGTSIPDLITSVLVARKGLGDMAVSSSVGSNIFDVSVGLPFPWLIYNILFGEIHVNSNGMACSVILLFIMLMFVILTIAAFNWRLNIGMAVVMFFLYFVFIAISLMLEKNIIHCSSIVNFL